MSVLTPVGRRNGFSERSPFRTASTGVCHGGCSSDHGSVVERVSGTGGKGCNSTGRGRGRVQQPPRWPRTCSGALDVVERRVRRSDAFCKGWLDDG